MQAPANLACLIHEAAGNNAERDDQATLYCKLCSVLRKDKSVSNGEKWTAKRVTSPNSVWYLCDCFFFLGTNLGTSRHSRLGM